MLRFVAGKRSRRDFLRIALGSVGLAGSAPTRCAARFGRDGFGRAKSVILVFASGGQSQFETWDPKPDAPLEVRGEFRPISTSVPGTLLGEHMPKLARIADRYTIVRSVSHDDLDHGSASYLALTGRFHQQKSGNPPVRPTDFPTYGAVLNRVRPAQTFSHSAVHLNGPALVPTQAGPGQFAGFLGTSHEPLLLGDVTDQTASASVLTPQVDLPPVRLSRRRNLLQTLDRYREQLGIKLASRQDTLYEQAFQMLSTPACRTAFDLSAESPSIRDRYGRNRSGQACLLARRLVQAGVPLITVIWNHSNRGQDLAPEVTDEYGWDTHNDIFEALKVHLLPRFDLGFSALLEDLDENGLLDETLVVCLGEFGRAPLVAREPRFAGNSPGRKHWAATYSAVMAGAGVQRGGVWGASDRIGAYPVAGNVGPWDIAATMYHSLGIDASDHFPDLLNRPHLIATGKPMTGLFG